MEAKFSNKVKEVIALAREEALRLGHDYIGTEHLMLGMIRDGEGPGVELLHKSGVSLDQLRQSIEHSTASTSRSSTRSTRAHWSTTPAGKIRRLTARPLRCVRTTRCW